MKIIYNTGFYLAHDAPDPAVMQLAGWRWNRMQCAWYTSDPLKAAPFRAYAIDEAKARLDALAETRTAAVAASCAVDTDLDFPAPDGLAYRPYQKAGIAFMLGRVSSLNADVMRLGKTVQSIGVMNATPDLKRALIVPPAGVRINWAREITRWNVHADIEADFCEGKHNPKSPALVCNYDILDRHIDYIHEIDWDVAIFDEAHALKNPHAQRTQTALGGGGKKPIRAKRRIFLTGTPIFTRPIDIFTICKECDPDGLGKSWWNFVHRYCNAHNTGFGLDTSGSSNLEELQFHMRSRFMIRREKKDIGAEMPPNRQTIILPKTGLSKLVKKEQNFVRQNLERFEQMLHARLDEAGVDQLLNEFGHLDGVDRDDADGGMVFQIAPAFEELSAIRQELSLAKAPMVGKFVEELLWSESKVVVFAHHRAVVAKLVEMFPGCASIIGGMSPTKRDAEQQRFQNDPDCRVLIGNITAAGQGISLSAADVVVFAELSWVPSEMEQAEERVWDPIKDRPVSSYWLVVEDSLDAKMAAILERRMRDIAKALKVASLGVGL